MKNKVVFWTDSFRFHTIKIFECFGARNDVVIAYCEQRFRDLGEYIPANVELYHIRNKEDVQALINKTEDWWHINNAFKIAPEFRILKYALKELGKRGCKIISLFQEKYPVNGWKGVLRMIKWWYIYAYGDGCHHRAIGYAGRQAYDSLRKAGVKRSRLFEFIYSPELGVGKTEEKGDCIVFASVGQLVPRKEVLESVRAMKCIAQPFKYYIAGSGLQENELKSLIADDDRFVFLGKQTQEELVDLYSKTDCLILASQFDGWGCVVNEALSQGCRAIVSDGCGVSSLVQDNEMSGCVFESGNWEAFTSLVINEIEQVEKTREERERIKAFARRFTPRVMSDYLEMCLDAIENKKSYPTAPWKE